MASAGVGWDLKIVTAAAGTHFSGKQSNQGKAAPLPQPERTEQLRCCMLEGRTD
jgi:hypothetical protein